MSEVSVKLVKELRDRTNLGLDSCRKALIASSGDIDLAIEYLQKAGELKAAAVSGRIATEGRVICSVESKRASILELNCQTDFVAKGDQFNDIAHVISCGLLLGGKVESFEDIRKQLVAKTGENIVIRRHEVWEARNENSLLLSYVHAGDKIAVLMEIEAPTKEAYQSQDFADFGINCAMQVAAMKPLSVSKDDINVSILAKQKEIFMAQMMDDEKLKSKPQTALEKICEGKISKWFKDVTLLDQDSVVSEDKKSINSLREELSKKLGGDVKVHRFIRYELGEGLEKKQENLADEVAKLIG